MIPAYGDPARGAVVVSVFFCRELMWCALFVVIHEMFDFQFFCWAAMVVYFVDAFLKFRAYRAGEVAQGMVSFSCGTIHIKNRPVKEY